IVIPPAIFFYYSTLFDSRFKTLQQNHHLRFLKKHGMAKSRQDGKVVYYSLANEDILSAIRVF
ncbi:helix-turn-helix domain-containing protein, partial [Enterococcus faecium]